MATLFQILIPANHQIPSLSVDNKARSPSAPEPAHLHTCEASSKYPGEEHGWKLVMCNIVFPSSQPPTRDAGMIRAQNLRFVNWMASKRPSRRHGVAFLAGAPPFPPP